MRELVAGADAFIHNWAPGKASQLGLDAADLAPLRPGLVYAWASAWGPELGARPGIGTDFMVQAFSGLGAALAPGEAPATSLMTLTDLLGGLVCAEGVVGGLLARSRTGTGQRVDSSLLSAATVLLEPGRRVAAVTALHEPIAAADGAIALSTLAAGAAEQVGAAIGLSAADRRGAPDDLAARIVAHLAAEPAAASIRRLREAGLGAVDVCDDLAALAGDPRFAAVLERGECVVPGPPWSFEP